MMARWALAPRPGAVHHTVLRGRGGHAHAPQVRRVVRRIGSVRCGASLGEGHQRLSREEAKRLAAELLAQRAAARGEVPTARITQAAVEAEERPTQRHAVALDKPVPGLIRQVAFMATAGLVVTLGGAASVHAGTMAPPGVETSTEAPAAEADEVVVKKKRRKKKVVPSADGVDGATTVVAADAEPVKAKKVKPVESPADKAAVNAEQPSEDAKAEEPKKAKNEKYEMSYTELWEAVGNKKVKRVEYCRDRSALVATLHEDAGHGLSHRVMMPFDPELFDYLIDNNVEVDVQQKSVLHMCSEGMAQLLNPILALAALFVLVMKSVGQGSDDLSTPLAKQIKSKDVTISMNDVAGIDHVREEIEELIDYLRDAERYMDMGAKLPAGVLMVGPPGTGKTLLAKAIAGEAGVPFFSAAGSEFTEMFVGVGASRVRNLFGNARKAAPCIIFIDEFDAIGTSRSLRMGSGALGGEEATNTINQMLTEMDGFEDNKGVVVLAATNRPAVLDEALTRPGRFDRVLHLPLPGVEGRQQILAVHCRGKKIEGDVDWELIARGCAGWTGADIANLMNEAAIQAIREGKDAMQEHHIVDALENLKRDSLTRGGQKVQSNSGSQEEMDALPMTVKRSICLIEAGRALLGHLIPDFDDVQRVSVFPGNRVEGHTSFVPQESHLESGVLTRGYLESQMVVAFAGRCAEKLVLGDEYVTGSSAHHLHDAQLIARQMVMRYGYSEKIGPVSLMSGAEAVYLKSDKAEVAVATMSPQTAALVQDEVLSIMQAAEAKAMYGLAKNVDALKEIETRLLDNHVLSRQELIQICEQKGAQPFIDASLKGFSITKGGGLVVPARPDDKETGETIVFPGYTFDGAPAKNTTFDDYDYSTFDRDKYIKEAMTTDPDVLGSDM